MNKVNLSAVRIEKHHSPKGRFRRLSQDISAALRQGNGVKTRTPSCPFEIELVRLPPRALNYPYHSHSAQWEFYMIVAGRGQARLPEGLIEVAEGDCFAVPPGQAHQLINTGALDLVYYVIADNPVSDARYFPDSDKWMLPGQPKLLRGKSAEYYDGEE